LHRFRDIVLDSFKIAINITTIPWDDLRKNFPWMSMDGQGTKWRRNIAENFNLLSRAHKRYRRTYGR